MSESEKSFIIGAHKYTAPRLGAGLYLVSTPIGNLSDISLRGLEVLAGADIVACEDTRTSRILLERYGIKQHCAAYHEHNAETAGAALLRALERGETVAVISDAGTPLLSDPGWPLAQDAIKAGIAVFPIPGASALLSALVGCGLPAHNFFFGGFLPPKRAARRQALEQWRALPCTMIFYESPRRTGDCLTDMAEIFGTNRPACLCRELTKKFETFHRAPLGELAAYYSENTPKGEIVLTIEGAAANEQAMEQEDIDALLLELAETLPASKAAHEAARQTGGKKQELYARLLELKKNN